MAILIDATTQVLVQGITGREGGFHARACREYGTAIVAGVTPGKGGTCFDAHIPVYDRVAEAVVAHRIDATCVFVPPAAAAAAIIEAVDAGIALIVCITEGIPVHDMLRVRDRLQGSGSMLIGPNCPGLIGPGQGKIGIMPGHIHRAGPVGVVSRSGTLTYEVVDQLTRHGVGQSTCLGIGGDPVTGCGFVEVLERFERDPDTAAVVMIGEIGGCAEEDAAAYIRRRMSKPVFGFIAGRTAPPNRRMGHAGALTVGGSGTAEQKITALRAAGVTVIDDPGSIGAVVAASAGHM